MYYLHSVFTAIFLSFLLNSCNSSGDERPNVVLFLVDDYGYGDISYEGNTQIMTPNIDRIAKNGARFTRFYQSGAACAPTRASLLTGRYHLETGVWGVHQGRDFLRLDEKTIGNAMQEAGYRTGAFGKWHSGKVWSYCAWNRGFDEGMHTSLYRYFDTRVLYNNKMIKVEGPISDVVGDRVVNFIESAGDNPFFAYVPFQSIHEPFNCPPAVFNKYKQQGYSDHVARLYGMIEVMDQNIGKVLDALERLDLTKNTVVMFLGDDGPSPGRDLSYSNRRMNAQERNERTRAWSRQLRGGKGSIWEGGMITPFYVQWPGRIQPGKDYAHIAGVVDIYPTIMEMCNIQEPKRALSLHGQSLWTVIEGEADIETWNTRDYFDNTNFYLIPRERINMDRPQMHYIAMHHGNYKLIRADRSLYGNIDTVYYELYDLVQDPTEQHNLIASEKELAAKLIPRIEVWYEGIIDRGRAFQQAIYDVGHPEEPLTPVNLDAAKEMYGSVSSISDARRRFTGWTEPRSGVNFEINAYEAGQYQVELGYQANGVTPDAVFKVYTQYDTALLEFDHPSRSVSGVLELPAGSQLLHLELMDSGSPDRRVQTVTNLGIRRIVAEQDHGLLRDAGMELISGHLHTKYRQGSATADFMYGSSSGEPLEVSRGSMVVVKPFAANTDAIAGIRVYLDFEEVFSSNSYVEKIELTPTSAGLHTINLEYETHDGIVTVTRGEVAVME